MLLAPWKTWWRRWDIDSLRRNGLVILIRPLRYSGGSVYDNNQLEMMQAFVFIVMLLVAYFLALIFFRGSSC